MSQSDRHSPPRYLALSCVGFIASAAGAQAIVPPPTPDEGQELEGVTVTDTAIDDDDAAYKVERPEGIKFTAPLIDTPRSIVVVPREVIKDTGSATLVEALRTVPGITFGAAEGGNPIGDRPFIRGFDSQGSTFVDGVRDIGAQSRETFAVDQIQIVRGSDSTLGGRGSAGGTLNIVSKLPRDRDFIEVAGSYGSDDYKRITGDVNYRLTPTVAVRINAMWHDQDVAGRDAIFQKRWGIAPAITIGLGTPTRLTAMYYHLHTDELPDSGFPYAYVTSAAINATPAGSSGTINSEPAIGQFTTANGTTGRISRNAFYGLKDRDFRNTDVDQATLRAEHDFGTLTLRNTARYSRTSQAYIYTQPDDSQGDVFGVPTGQRNVGTLPSGRFNDYTGGGRVWRRANTRFGTSESMIDQLDLAGTFDTGAIKHSIATGGEISFERAERGTFNVNTGTGNATNGLRCGTAPGVAPYNCTSLFDPNPDDPWANYVAGSTTATTPITKIARPLRTINDARTMAVYAFDSITIAEPLIVNLGIRYEDFRNRTTLPIVGTTRPIVSRDDGFVTYQAGVVYKPSATTSVYASYATSATPPNSLLGEGQELNGFAAIGNVSAQQAADTQLKVERSRSYEAGAKADVFGGNLSLTAALFQTETKNARVTIDTNTVAFVGERRVRGLELGFNGRITPDWSVFGGYTYLDAKIVDGGLSALTAAAVGARAAQIVYVPSVNTGRQFPQTAKHSFTIWSDYKIGRFSVGGGAFYTSRVFGGYADNRYATQTATGVVTVTPATVVIARSVPSYWRFDARAGFKVTDNIELAVNVQNLTNKTYFSQAYSSHYATIAPGRSAFGTLTVKY